MRSTGNALMVALLAGTVVLCANCASTNVNPPQARAHKGYVDFYSPGNTNLSWSVKRSDSAAGPFKPVFSSPKPLPDGVLRLESDPGVRQFEITFLNRVVQAPLTLQVPVQEGMVTPVKVELVPIAPTSVVRKEEQVGPNVSGAGRKTRYSTQPGAIERLVASVQAPVPYQPRQ